MINAKNIRNVFDYVDGKLFWKIRTHPYGPDRTGLLAGRLLRDGYWQIRYQRVAYRRGRLVFLWHTGRWPEPEVDHRNRVRDDDCFDNLREVSKQENAFNKLAKGCSKYAGTDRWRAHITVDNRQLWLGVFKSEKAARQAYLLAKPIYHKIRGDDRE